MAARCRCCILAAGPTLAPGIQAVLGEVFAAHVPVAHVVAYLAALVAHPGFTATFADELTTPGIRVPLTSDAASWVEAVALGCDVVWLHTFGVSMADPLAGRPAGDVFATPPRAGTVTAEGRLVDLPEQMTYDTTSQRVHIGGATFGPVPPAVWAYDVGGRGVLKSWFGYRKLNPGGRRSSPLDDIHVDRWQPEWTIELIELLTVLSRLIEFSRCRRRCSSGWWLDRC